jgi:hypothetical protein
MDMSNRVHALRQVQNNTVQVEGPPWQQPKAKTRLNCGKEGHFQAECCAPRANQPLRRTQVNLIIDKPEDMKEVQAPLTPKGILNNMLAMFNRMPDHMNHKLIQKYEGKSQDFLGV